jgi:hypothetical protein
MMKPDEDNGIYLIATATNAEVLRHLMRALPFADDMYGPDRRADGLYEVKFHNTKAEREAIRSWAQHYYPSALFFGIKFEEEDGRDL